MNAEGGSSLYTPPPEDEGLSAWHWQLKPGDRVSVLGDDGNEFEAVVKRSPWQLGHGEWVVGLNGRAGGYLLRRVQSIIQPTDNRGIELVKQAAAIARGFFPRSPDGEHSLGSECGAKIADAIEAQLGGGREVQTAATKLLPCPHCAGGVDIDDLDAWLRGVGYRVECERCYLSMWAFKGERPDQLAARWNRRDAKRTGRG